jgi:hypothetical protein
MINSNYEQEMLSFVIQVKKILKANLSEICETIFIKYEDYSRSIKHWASKDPEVRKVGALLLDNLKINKSPLAASGATAVDSKIFCNRLFQVFQHRILAQVRAGQVRAG